MKIFKLKDGGSIAATSPADFVSKLHSGSFFDSQGTDQEYMKRFARRILELEGSVVRTDSADNFLSDLINCGFVL